MKRLWLVKAVLSESRPWLVALGLTDLVFILFAWLAYPESFGILFGLMLLFSLAIPVGTLAFRALSLRRVSAALRAFLIEPDTGHEEGLVRLLNQREAFLVRQLGTQLRQGRDELNNSRLELDEYENYIEAWVHEMKTPLSLMLLVLDNRFAEMSPVVLQRMTHVHSRMMRQVKTILYFARLRAVHKDYLFEPLSIHAVLREAISDNRASLEEAGVSIEVAAELDAAELVISDRKSLFFILNQLIGNGIKHARTLRFSLGGDAADATDRPFVLQLSDDGPGVAPSDLPFLFEKGFTSLAGQAGSSGMGLYLVAQLAHDLGIELHALSPPPPPSPNGLTILLSFPNTPQ